MNDVLTAPLDDMSLAIADMAMPARVLINDGPAWLWPDGRVTPAIAGGAPDDDPPGDDPPPEDPPGTDPPPDPAAELEKWRNLARKHEAAAKKNAAAADKLAELENASKSDLERLQEASAAAEKRAAEAEARALRLEIAAAKGLTPAQAKRLVGESREDLEADADELLESFRPAGQGDEGDGEGEAGNDGRAGVPRQPLERARSGARPQAEPAADPSKLAESILSSPF